MLLIYKMTSYLFLVLVSVIIISNRFARKAEEDKILLSFI